jgi:chemotaxis methyl-accepting protein methylase
MPVRIACVGGGAGEEPYTFAMLLEHAGLEGSIEATDVDASALEAAHAGHYPLTAAAELPAAFADDYLEPVVVDGQPRYRVQDNLRARVRFARADITADAEGSGSDFDLVSCRNVLIYLQRSAQERAMRRLLAMTRREGVLCLGEAEWPLPEFSAQLEPLPNRTRLFRVLRPA